jgi:hypothetical protein
LPLFSWSVFQTVSRQLTILRKAHLLVNRPLPMDDLPAGATVVSDFAYAANTTRKRASKKSTRLLTDRSFHDMI